MKAETSYDEGSIVANDFASFFGAHPRIERVYFNGAEVELALPPGEEEGVGVGQQERVGRGRQLRRRPYPQGRHGVAARGRDGQPRHADRVDHHGAQGVHAQRAVEDQCVAVIADEDLQGL